MSRPGSHFLVGKAVASFRTAVEDRFAVHRLHGGLVVALADGAGGIPGASATADFVVARVGDAAGRPDIDLFDGSAWAAALDTWDHEIDRSGRYGETTAVVVAVTNDGRIVGASAGDSGAVVVHPDGAIDDLTEGQHRKRRLGSGRAKAVAFERASFDGVLVVASDGLLDHVPQGIVAEIVRDTPQLQDAAGRLVETAALPSGDFMDDVTVVVVRRYGSM